MLYCAGKLGLVELVIGSKGTIRKRKAGRQESSPMAKVPAVR